MQKALLEVGMGRGKIQKLLNILYIFFLGLCFNAQTFAKGKTAIVFSGGGLQTAAFLGVLAGVESEGVHPDVLVGACGGSIASAIAQLHPTTEKRYEFLHSEDFHRMMRLPKITDGLNAFKTLMFLSGLKSRRHQPSFLDTYVMHVDPNLGFQSAEGFPFATQGPRAVIVAARMNVPESENKNPFYHFSEVFFTDPISAKDLEGFNSPVSIYSHLINNQTEVMTDVPIVHASRASITDPYFIDTLQLKNRYYLTGAIDLYPIEAAHALAEEVIMPLTSGLNDSFETPTFKHVFGYNINQRLRAISEMSSRYWVDYTDFGKFQDKSGFNPKPKLSLLNAMKSGVPEDFQEFLEKVELQWKWGFERGKEAIRLGREKSNYKLHLRNLNKRNSTAKLRNWIREEKKRNSL